MTPFDLVTPSLRYLRSYAEALERGWSPDTQRPEAAQDELAQIAENSAAFVGSLDDREGRGPPVTLPDGAKVPRLPGFHRWMWDGEFCGSIGFRWQPGGAALPPYVLGHIGCSVVPWKQRRGYATRALALLLPEVSTLGLDHVDLTTDPDNLPSQRVVLSNSGKFVDRFHKVAAFGSGEVFRYRIYLNR